MFSINKYLTKNTQNFFAIVIVFFASTLIPFITFSIFSNFFLYEPFGFWRFTPKTPMSEISKFWIIATVIANIIIAIVSVFAYKILSKGISGNWKRKGLIFSFFAVFLGVYIPVWSFFTISNISWQMTIALMIDGTFEYTLYSMLIAYILKSEK